MSDDFKSDCVYKVLLLGDSTVGKTCFLMRYTDNTFQEIHMSTIGLDYRLKNITLENGKNIKIQIWDTAGQEAFQAITRTYYKGAVGALLVYDITRHETFEHIDRWLNEIKANGSKDICCILIGNKKDLEDQRQVKYEEGEKLAKSNNLLFLETSAKSAENVQEAFLQTAEKILDQITKTGVDPTAPSKNVKITIDDDDDEKEEKGKKCC